MKIRYKKTGSEGHSSSFNVNAISEVLVYFDDGGGDSAFIHELDVLLPTGWKDMERAFTDNDLVRDNYNTHFFLTPVDSLQPVGAAKCVSSGVWLGVCRWRKYIEPEWVGVYTLSFSWLGVVFRVCTNGTPWTFKGRRYHFHHSDGVSRFALGKYAAAIHWHFKSKQ